VDWSDWALLNTELNLHRGSESRPGSSHAATRPPSGSAGPGSSPQEGTTTRPARAQCAALSGLVEGLVKDPHSPPAAAAGSRAWVELQGESATRPARSTHLSGPHIPQSTTMLPRADRNKR